MILDGFIVLHFIGTNCKLFNAQKNVLIDIFNIASQNILGSMKDTTLECPQWLRRAVIIQWWKANHFWFFLYEACLLVAPSMNIIHAVIKTKFQEKLMSSPVIGCWVSTHIEITHEIIFSLIKFNQTYPSWKKVGPTLANGYLGFDKKRFSNNIGTMFVWWKIVESTLGKVG